MERVEEVLSNIPLRLFIHLPHLSGFGHLDQPDTIYKFHTVLYISFCNILFYPFNSVPV